MKAHVLVLGVSILVLGSGLLPLAMGQGAPAATGNTLYLHIKSSPRTYWMSFEEKAEGHDSTSAGYNAAGFVLTEAGVAAWTLPYTPELTEPVSLNKAGLVETFIYIGSCQATVDTGRVDVSFTLKAGDVTVASGAAKNTLYQGVKNEVKWSGAPAVDVIPAGPLTWTIRAAGAGSQICLGAGGAQFTRMVLPVVQSAAPTEPVAQTINETLEGAAAAIDHDFANATSDTYNFNWTTNSTDLDLRGAVEVTNGSVRYTVRDSSDAVVAEGNVSESGNVSQSIVAAAGQFRIELAYTSFVGSLRLELAPAGAASQTSANTTSAGNSTSTAAGPQTQDDADTPGLGVVAIIGALVVGLAVRRRRIL